MKKIIFTMMLGLLLPSVAAAQNQDDDFGLWYSVGASKKFSQKLSVEAEVEYRTFDDAKKTDRWSGGVGLDYKVLPWLKASAGYTFLYDKRRKESFSYYDDEDDEGEPWEGFVKKYKSATFWSPRHRFNVDLTFSQNLGRFKLSLRERWQYTYRPEKTATRDVYEYAYDNDGNLDPDFCTTESESKTYSGKGTNVLRSRLQVDYNIPHCKVDPFVSAELYNSWAVKKVRYSVGADWKLTKQHVFTVAYRYQDLRGDYDEEPDMHIVSVGYKFKF